MEGRGRVPNETQGPVCECTGEVARVHMGRDGFPFVPTHYVG